MIWFSGTARAKSNFLLWKVDLGVPFTYPKLLEIMTNKYCKVGVYENINTPQVETLLSVAYSVCLCLNPHERYRHSL